jgi:uncharacterized membrane protein
VKKLGIYGVTSFCAGIAALLLTLARPYAPSTISLVSVEFLATIAGFVMMVGALLKLPIALSAAQTAVTAILTFWADRMEWINGLSNRYPPHFARLHLAVVNFRETLSSINAPTFPLNYAGLNRYRVLSVGEILYLVAVAVLWYLVGYFCEQRQPGLRRAVSVAILIWGIVLLCVSTGFTGQPAFKAGFFISLEFLNASLYAVWGLVLIWFGVKNLRAFSRAQHSVRS